MGPVYLISAATKKLGSSMEYRALLALYAMLWTRSDKTCSPMKIKLVELGAHNGSMRERTRRDLDKLQELGWIGLGEDKEFGMNVVLKTSPERPDSGRSGAESGVPIQDADDSAASSADRPDSGRFDHAALATLDPDDDEIWPGNRPDSGRGVPIRDALRAENGSLGVPIRDAAGFAGLGALLSRGLDLSLCHSNSRYLYTTTPTPAQSEAEPKSFLRLVADQTQKQSALPLTEILPDTTTDKHFPGLEPREAVGVWAEIYRHVRQAGYVPSDQDLLVAQNVIPAMAGFGGGRSRHLTILSRAVRIFLTDLSTPDPFVTANGRLPVVFFQPQRLRKYLDLALQEAASDRRALEAFYANEAHIPEMHPENPQDFHDALIWEEYVRRLVHWTGDFPSLITQIRYANPFAEHTVRTWWKAGAEFFGLPLSCPWLENLEMLAERRANA